MSAAVSAPPPVAPERVTPTVMEIVEAAAREFGVRVPDLLGPTRSATLVCARHVAIFAARRLRGMSFPELGRAFNHRDHTSSMYAVHKLDRAIKADVYFYARVLRVENAALGVAASRRKVLP